MSTETILFLATTGTQDAEIRTAAESAAADGSHLSVLLHETTPTLPINALGALPYGGPPPVDTWSVEVGEAQKAISARGDAVEGLLAAAGCSGDVRPVLCAYPDIAEMVARAARVADRAVMAANLNEVPDIKKEMLHGILYDAPIGVTLNAPVGLSPKHVMIGWDDGPAAARAVHLALPMLKAANAVTIACFDPTPLSDGQPYEPGAALAAWLGHHGCKLTVAQYPTGGQDVAQGLLARGAELGADLLVTGAYGHSRMRQAIFGGTTRSLIEQTAQPVFLGR